MDGNWTQVVFDVQTERTVIEPVLELFPPVSRARTVHTQLSVPRSFSHTYICQLS